MNTIVNYFISINLKSMENYSSKNCSGYESQINSSLETSFQDPLNMAFVEQDSTINLQSSKSLNLEDISSIITEQPKNTHNKQHTFTPPSLNSNVSTINPRTKAVQQDQDETIVQMLGIMKNQDKKLPADNICLKTDYQFRKKRMSGDPIIYEGYGAAKVGNSNIIPRKIYEPKESYSILDQMQEKQRFQRFLKKQY